jgi:hypothetical protein
VFLIVSLLLRSLLNGAEITLESALQHERIADYTCHINASICSEFYKEIVNRFLKSCEMYFY